MSAFHETAVWKYYVQHDDLPLIPYEELREGNYEPIIEQLVAEHILSGGTQ